MSILFISIGLLFVSILLGLTTRISINCSIKDNFTLGTSIIYILVANILAPLYLIYYFFYRSSIKDKPCY